MSPALANFLFEAANFLLLAAALGWLLFKPVRRALDVERERHAEEARRAEGLRAEAEALAKEARAERDAAGRELEERRREVLAAAREEASRLLEEARRTQDAERQALEHELESARRAGAAALAETVGRIAGESVRRLLEALEGPSLDAALVRAACAELEALPAPARRSALVESARALDGETRGRLRGVLGDDFAERIVGELGAGIRVTTSAGQVDASAVSLARRAAQVLAAAGTAPAGGEGSADG